MNASYLTEPPDGDEGDGEWVTARLSYGVLRETRQLLQFSDSVEVLSPPEVRAELAAAAASVTRLYQPVVGESL
jgi:predicted DNA-binding transcriptional regulator YafY